MNIPRTMSTQHPDNVRSPFFASNSVVKKVLMRYETSFSKKKLGKDMNLTYRVPNPDVEKKPVLAENIERAGLMRGFLG